MADKDYFVHETAVVEMGASVGAGTQIWHHGQIRSGAQVGERCVFGKNVYVDTGVVIGHGCKLQNNVNVYQGVTIEDDVFVGPSATFTNDLLPRAFRDDWAITPTKVNRGASVGAHATIVCGITLGSFCMVAAGAIVTRDVEPHQLVVGTPARHAGWICQCGNLLYRSDLRPEDFGCERCKSE